MNENLKKKIDKLSRKELKDLKSFIVDLLINEDSGGF